MNPVAGETPASPAAGRRRDVAADSLGTSYDRGV
jgi:hypothetical protein